jgi:hypothetical protein
MDRVVRRAMLYRCPKRFRGHLSSSASARSTYDALAAGHHANEFDSIAFREKTVHPFSLVKRGGIVLD